MAAQHTTKVFGQIQVIDRGFNEVDALKIALADTTIPFDTDMVEAGIVRVDWNCTKFENFVSAFNDDFARAVDNIVRHPEMEGMGLYGQFMLITNGFNDTMGITSVTVRDGRVYVEKGVPVWSSPARRI